MAFPLATLLYDCLVKLSRKKARYRPELNSYLNTDNALTLTC